MAALPATPARFPERLTRTLNSTCYLSNTAQCKPIVASTGILANGIYTNNLCVDYNAPRLAAHTMAYHQGRILLDPTPTCTSDPCQGRGGVGRLPTPYIPRLSYPPKCHSDFPKVVPTKGSVPDGIPTPSHDAHKAQRSLKQQQVAGFTTCLNERVVRHRCWFTAMCTG